MPKPATAMPATSATTTILRWVPPVEDVALLELPRGAGQDVCARTGGVSIQERENILKLIAKPNRAAGLVEACPR